MAEPEVPFPMCFPACTACCFCNLHFSLAVAVPRKCFSWELVKHCVNQINQQKWLTQKTWSSSFGVNIHRFLWEIDKGLSGIWEGGKHLSFFLFRIHSMNSNNSHHLKSSVTTKQAFIIVSLLQLGKLRLYRDEVFLKQ